MKHPYLILLALTGLAGAGATAAPSLSARVTDQNEWTVRWGDQSLCTYRFGPGLTKAYVSELRTIEGRNILRDSPADHLHHHALMFGIRVNGVNFWEETGNYGIQESVEVLTPRGRANREDSNRTRFSHRLHWRPVEGDRRPLLIEDRTITVSVDPAQREVALMWRSRFELAPGVDKVRLEGANYHGLGLRFLQELDPLASHWIGGEKLNLADNRQDVRAAPWAAVTFDAPDLPATVVLAGSPSNRPAPARFFSMHTPFAYLSATQNLDQTPLEYVAGERWTLSHLVLLYPELKNSTDLDARVERWARN